MPFIFFLLISLSFSPRAFSVSCSQVQAESFKLSKEEKKYFIQTALKLQVDFPPSKYDYVFVGRSLSVLYYMMKNKYPTSSFPLPASKVKNWDKWFIEYPPEHVLKHLAKFLKPVTKKNILLLDYVDSGRSLGKLKTLLERQYPEKNFVSLGIADASHKKLPNHHNHKFYYTETTQQSILFAFEKYDKIAEYSRAILDPVAENLEVKKQHSGFSIIDHISEPY